jgi:hypothetical protein
VACLPDTPQIRPLALAKFFESLLGRKVTANASAALLPKPANVEIVAEYCNDQGAIGALWVCNLALGCGLGAAFAMLPAQGAAEAAKKGKFEGAHAENFQELANVLASLFNRAGTAHLNLRKVHAPGSPLPPEVSAAVPVLTGQLAVELAVAGYSGGRLTLLYRH